MAAITYTAHLRAPLVASVSPAHVAGTQYSLDVKLQQYSETIDMPKSSHISIGGNVETVLKRASNTMSAVFIWPNSEHEFIKEFLYSVAGGEAFTVDPYGTIAVPSDPAIVVCMNPDFALGRMTHGEVHWRSVSMALRPAI